MRTYVGTGVGEHIGKVGHEARVQCGQHRGVLRQALHDLHQCAKEKKKRKKA